MFGPTDEEEFELLYGDEMELLNEMDDDYGIYKKFVYFKFHMYNKYVRMQIFIYFFFLNFR